MSNEKLLFDEVAELKRSIKKRHWPILAIDWEQKWKSEDMGRYFHDQYGFRIDVDHDQDKPYTLSHGGTVILHCYRMMVAKLISCIIMNDIINHKDRPHD